MDRFAMITPRMFDLVAARAPQPEAKSLLRLEFLARDPDLARRFLRQLAGCTAATLELTPTEVSREARDLDVEVYRLLEPWGLVNLPEIPADADSSMGGAPEGPSPQLVERLEALRRDTDWKCATRSGARPRTWTREGAGGGGFDRENTPLSDVANPSRGAVRVTERLNQPVAFDVLPEFQRLAEQARDESAKPLHQGWVIQVGRGSGEARFTTSGPQAPRLHFVFARKETPAR
jgi:hypothetical protein